MLIIEALYYNVVLTTGPANFLSGLYLGFCVVYVLHRTGGGVRDTRAWRMAVYGYFVVVLCVAVKMIWLLFLLGVWSDYGAMVCSKSQSVRLTVDEALVSEHEWMQELLE